MEDSLLAHDEEIPEAVFGEFDDGVFDFDKLLVHGRIANFDVAEGGHN